MSGPRTGSVCSGYEGLGMAVQSVLGGELAWVADNDPGAAAVLAHRFPGVANIGDIKAVDWVSLGTVDILCGGYPCQPWSQAGQRLGTADERHIWPYVAKAVAALRPALVVLENVQGHLTLGFDTVLADLAALGYDAEWIVVTASAVGACHRRARLFILAFPGGKRSVAGAPLAVVTDGTWAEPDVSLFGTLPFTGRIPGSGRMAGGRVYPAEPGPADMAGGLLKTPTAQLAVNGGSQHPDKRRAGGHGPTLADQAEHELLPTPTAREKGGSNARHGDTGHGDDLPEAVRYLPTPGATDGKGGNVPAGRMREGRPRTAADADLPVAVALLPTPRTTDGTKGGPNQRGSSGDLMLPSAVTGLLPTPQATDGQGGPRAVPAQRTSRGKDHGPRLRDVAPALLPTPVAGDGDRASLSYERGNPTLLGALLPTPSAGNFNDGESPESWQRRKDFHAAKETDPTRASMPLAVAAQQLAAGADCTAEETAARLSGKPGLRDAVDWGPYEAAVRRWEAVLGRPAPRPTLPGKTGERLNPELPEWMMGLPAGWITAVPGLSRNAQLKLAGNGVVPQQGALAVRLLLRRVARDRLVPAVLVPFLDRAGLGYGEAA